jgi:hypothetical protein
MSSRKLNVTAQPLQSVNISLEVGNTLQRPSSPPDGYIRINSETNYVEVYYDSRWINTMTVGLAFVETGWVSPTAIFGYGSNNGASGESWYSSTNLISNTGIISADITGVGTAREGLAAASYGFDKAIFGYGGKDNSFAPYFNYSMTNLVSNAGIVATDTTGVGTARQYLAAATYGLNKAMFGYGAPVNGSTLVTASITNLVSNTGVVATDNSTVATGRFGIAATGYGTDKAIFGYGYYGVSPAVYTTFTNLVSNTGVVANDVTNSGLTRDSLAAAGYGGDKAIFAYGVTAPFGTSSVLVTNTGIVGRDNTIVGTQRWRLAAAGYGTDKAIFAYGINASFVALSMSNLVSNTGVVAADTTNSGVGREGPAAAGYGS